MVNKQKNKGSRWEHDAVEILNRKVERGRFKRIPGSGAIGTVLGESILTGDITGKVDGFYKGFKIEAKSGYGKGQMAVKKIWLDKIKEEATAAYAIPVLLGKFSDIRSGVKHFAILDIDTFIDILNYTSDLKRELDLIYEEKANAQS